MSNALVLILSYIREVFQKNIKNPGLPDIGMKHSTIPIYWNNSHVFGFCSVPRKAFIIGQKKKIGMLARVLLYNKTLREFELQRVKI